VALAVVILTNMAMEAVAVRELLKPQLHQMMLLFLHSLLVVQVEVAAAAQMPLTGRQLTLAVVQVEHLMVALVALVVRLLIHLLVTAAVVQQEAVLAVVAVVVEALAEALLQITQLQPTAAVAQVPQHEF
jgi:hypothetical protein